MSCGFCCTLLHYMKYVSVFSRPRSPYWYVSFLDPKTGKRNPGKATPFRRDSPQSKRKALDFGNDLTREGRIQAEVAASEYWENWVPGFLEDHYRNSTTVVRARGAWSHWRLYLQENGILIPKGLDYGAAVGYVAWRSAQKRRCGKPVKRNTALCDLRIMSVVMNEARRRGYCEFNPCARPGLRKDDSPEKPEILDDEERVIRKRLPEWVVQDPKTYGWMPVAFEIAIRQGCRLRETQVDLFRDVDFKRNVITFHAKGKKIFATMLHPKVRDVLWPLRKEGKRRSCSVPYMGSKHWRDFLDWLEMPHLSFHCIRVTVITRLARAGVSEQQAMAYVSHSSRLVHHIYQRLKPADVGAAVAALD